MINALDTFQDHGSAPFSFDGFASLIAPIGKQRFLDEYWERKPFVIQRRRAGYFDSLLSLSAIDRLVGTRVLREPDIRVVSAHAKQRFADISRDGVADRNKLLREHGAGATMVFDQIDRQHAPLDKALARCEVDLQVPCRANAFLTPPGEQGFNLHYDTHDVVVLQIAGTKSWQICNAPLPLPHEEQRYDHTLSAKAEQIAGLTMFPGDVLFLPRGYIHAASADDTTSLHVSIALRTRALREVAVGALRTAVQESPAMRKVALFRHCRSPARVAEARAELHRLVDRMDLAAALDAVLSDFIMTRSRPLEGALMALESPPDIGPDTPLRVRADCLFHPFSGDDTIRLAIDGKSVMLPSGVMPALDFMRRGEPFTARQLPGLEEESRLLLARKLYGTGLLASCA